MDLVMHPSFNTARRKLRDIRRLIRKPLDAHDIALFKSMWAEALEKDATGFNCVLLVNDLIEQNTPLKY
ncbi:hypothetical protein [Bradyrhizobium erythrophlei]|uniref:Uncharacterized protein n=1 Tax=Bradyrhizobium erythrophlei TaxID=1437360 RepID=A0A1M5PU50_9BRAD|nr:hypothetical protein [Bradyrhizobium erythrophlei]SHH05009.1 hypothetical protein SAMN05443248_3501 [Bradyrhizobium erythrophlei]